MTLDTLDMRLYLDMDSYLKQFETFKFIDLLMSKYNQLDKTKELYILSLKDSKFYHNYSNIYNLLSVLTLKRKYDDSELTFISELAYKQKGSVESLKMILNLVDCDYSDLYIDNDYTLYLHIDLRNVKEIYLAQKYLYILCKDLLFIKQNSLIIDSMSIRYRLDGSINKRYAIYTTYDLDTTSIDSKDTEKTTTTTEIIENPGYTIDNIGDEIDTYVENNDKTNTQDSIKKTITEIKDGFCTVEVTTTSKGYRVLDTLTIDTYTW